MVDSSNKKRKTLISEGDIATLLQRYDTVTILKLLQEMAYYAEPKMDWNEVVKKTSTGITNAREYQLLWRHLAYRHSLLPLGDNAQLRDDDSDIESELEASPAVGADAVSEAIANVKVMAASYVPSESDIPEDSTVEAPLTINIPYGLQRGPHEPSDSYWSSRGMNITFPVSLQKAAEGTSGNGVASSMAPRKRRKKWSTEEDEELIAAVKRHGDVSWALIAKEEFEGERTATQLCQRWGTIKRRGDTSNSATQSGLHRTEAQMAVNHALSLAVGNRVPAKKLAVGIPSVLSSGSITGAQANSGSSLQCQQQSQPASAPTAKSRVTAKKATATTSSRELMVTANSVAAAACMSGLATAASVPKVEPGKNAVAPLVPKAEPVKSAFALAASLPHPSGAISASKAEPTKTALAASLPRSSVIISASKAEPVKTASAASLPHLSGIKSASTAEPVNTAAAASLPRLSGIISASKAEPVKTASAPSLPRASVIMSAPKAEPVIIAPAASLPRLSGIISASTAEPVNTASTASLPRLSGIILASKAEPVKPASAPSLPRPPGIMSAPKAEPVKTAPAASLPRPLSISSAQKAEPVKSIAAAAVTNHQRVGPLNIRHAINGSPNHVLSSSPSNKSSPMAPLSKGPPIQNNSIPSGFTHSRLAPTQRVSAATVMPQKPSTGLAVTASGKPFGAQKEQNQGNGASPFVTPSLQPNKTISTNSAISTGKLVAAKVEMPKKNQVQTEVGGCTNKSPLNKPPEKESSTAVPPPKIAEAESKPKDEISREKSQDVATVTVTGTAQKEL